MGQHRSVGKRFGSSESLCKVRQKQRRLDVGLHVGMAHPECLTLLARDYLVELLWYPRNQFGTK